jgi:hypothetical protein
VADQQRQRLLAVPVVEHPPPSPRGVHGGHAARRITSPTCRSPRARLPPCTRATCTPLPPGRLPARAAGHLPPPRSPRPAPALRLGAAVGGMAGWLVLAAGRVVSERSSGLPARSIPTAPWSPAPSAVRKMRKSSRVARGCPFQVVTTSPTSRPASAAADAGSTLAMSAPRSLGSERRRPARGYGLAVDAQERARRLASFAQPRQQQLDHVDGDGEPHARAGCGPPRTPRSLPIAAPAASTSGPPELPTFIEASVWM